jgi:hypothetical protein
MHSEQPCLLRGNVLASYRDVLRWCALLCALLGGAGPAAGQVPDSALPNPRLFAVTPPGGRAGSSVEVTFAGTDLEEPQGMIFSNPALKAAPVLPPPPPPDPKTKKPAPMPKPVITKFKVTIPAGTPLGSYDVRLVNKWGISNPRAFVVGDLKEVQEVEPNDDVDKAQRVELDSTINGLISSATDVDYFVFNGKRGQRVVVSCAASSIDSRLEAALELYDKAGRKLAFNRHFRDGDALVDCTLPADGDYYVRLFESVYSGGSAEHFYRLSISTAPWIDAIFPPAVEPGKPAKVTVYGRNLPNGQLDPTAAIDGRILEKVTVTTTPPSDPAALHRLAFSGHVPAPMSGMDGFEYRVRNASGSSNPYLLTYARAPVVLDNGANDTPETAQEVPVPSEIAGWIEKKRDRDWYTFSAKQGAVYSMEIFSDRTGSPIDTYFTLRNAANKQDLGEFDDNAETLSPIKFYTRNDDPPRFRFTVPADGKYQVQVSSRDADVRSGPNLLYRLRIAPEVPDFRLIVLAPAENLPDEGRLLQGGQQFYTAMAWRLDGFTGPITLTAEGLPAGVTCPPQTLGTGLTQIPIVLSAAPNAAIGAYEFKVKGTATINGQTVVREARTASITWPVTPGQGVPAISRLCRNLFLAVRDKAPFSLTATLDKTGIVQGDKGTLSLKLARLWPEFNTPLQVVAADLPPNLIINNNQPITMAPNNNNATGPVVVNANVTPGTYNIVLRASAPIPFNKDPMAKQKQPVNVQLPSTPVTLTVIPKQLATLSLANATVTAKPGTQGELQVKVARMFDYAGEFKVQVVIPAGIKGVSATETTIPAGKDEVRAVLKIAPDAAPGNRADLIVRAVALFNGNLPVTHEVKFNVNVIK